MVVCVEGLGEGWGGGGGGEARYKIVRCSVSHLLKKKKKVLKMMDIQFTSFDSEVVVLPGLINSFLF